MSGYILNFMVYTMAMGGLIFFALFIYKKVMNGGFCQQGSKMLSVEETMNINPRKSLMIVRAGNERFLIASDIDKTTLISKLEGNNSPNLEDIINTALPEELSQNTAKTVEKTSPYSQNSQIKRWHPELVKNDKNVSKRPVRRNYNSAKMSDTMREMAKKINEL